VSQDTCTCPVPAESPNPRTTSCNRCAKPIDYDADWVVNDRTHNEVLNRVEQALRAADPEEWPKDKPPPIAWVHFRNMCFERERNGRERFGFEYLTRDNSAAGAEESTDGSNYTYMETRRFIREGRTVPWDLALKAIYHDYMAYLTRLEMRQAAKGAP
jgi:hypothetical protein